jgi:hypothetical protein
MNKIILLFSALMIFIFFTGCKAPACSPLSWGETSQVEENIVEMKYSAGDKGGSINDYWDNVDVNDLIKKIQKMRFVKNDTCKTQDYESGEDVEFECPEFVPETIEFGEVVGCRFDTPPGEETLCMAGPLEIFFTSNTYFDRIMWRFDSDDPQMYKPGELEVGEFDILITSKDDNIMAGQFTDESKTSFRMRFLWKEEKEEEQVQKEISIIYSVETKE